MRSFFALVVWLFLCVLTFSMPAHAQIHSPVKWNFVASPTKNNSEAILMFTATLDNGWHIYSQHIESGGPLPTTFKFLPGTEYSLNGAVEEHGNVVKLNDPTFMMEVTWYAKTVTFIQKVELNVPSTVIKGQVEYMVCDEDQCLPPEMVEFSLEVNINHQKKDEKDLNPAKKTIDRTVENSNRVPQTDTVNIKIQAVQTKIVADSSAAVILKKNEEDKSENKTESSIPATSQLSLWAIFVGGFLGGLAALIMPCVFPMIPFTVAIFSKRGAIKDGSAVAISIAFGFSIILIYVVLGLLITIIFGSDALNDFATNGILNIAFFLLLVAFAASFLGAFEINLPSSWVNRINVQGDRDGVIGIFFVAATLVLVSFSCTGPLIGGLLVEAAAMSNYKGPVIGMLGFSIALALPFTVFSMFPSWLRSLPKSGGWLNSVKVVLGFLELALALKFLSNVDLAYHWDWFDREVFLVLWIVIFGLLGLYLLGKIKLPNDTPMYRLPASRLFLAMIALAFTLYMIPGLWGAPLKSISAFLPPPHTQDFDLYSASFSPVPDREPAETSKRKYSDIFHSPLNLNAFFDYQEGLAYARKVNKPVMIDFTGHACVNCRKMETVVWSDPRIFNRIKQDFVLVQLYVDDKTELPVTEQFESAFSGKKIETIGNKWSDFQATVFNANSQPYYVLLDLNEKPLINAQGAEYDIELFKDFLDKGLNEFRNR